MSEMMNKYFNHGLYVGIDPGQNGGIAMICGDRYTSVPMPETRLQAYTLLRLWVETYGVVSKTVAVESVHSMPKQGVASTFKFGKGYGEILGICTSLGFKIIEPTPQAWKKEMLAGTDKSKEVSIQAAENMFPAIDLVQKGCRKAHDGAAEAILLAEYAKRQSKGDNNG